MNPFIANSTAGNLRAPDIEYPSLLRRFQAAFINGILTFVLIGCFIALANAISEQSDWLKIIAVILGASYGPVAGCYSRTLGQRITGMRIVPAEEGGRLNLPAMYVRYVIKALLGWISFITIHSNP